MGSLSRYPYLDIAAIYQQQARGSRVLCVGSFANAEESYISRATAAAAAACATSPNGVQAGSPVSGSPPPRLSMAQGGSPQWAPRRQKPEGGFGVVSGGANEKRVVWVRFTCLPGARCGSPLYRFIRRFRM